MKTLGYFSLIALAILFLLFACPGGDMDRVCAAQSKGKFEVLVTNEAGIRVEYLIALGVKKIDTCATLYYNDATGCWRLDSGGIVLREKYSRFYPRLKETWLLTK